MPHPPEHKLRWYQYSLRSLFILTAALALWLGYVTDAARQQRNAVEVLTALDASVFYEDDLFYKDGLPNEYPRVFSMGEVYYTTTGRRWYYRSDAEPRGPKWLRDWIGEDYFRTVVAVDLAQLQWSETENVTAENVTAEHIQHISKLTYLKRLDLDWAGNLADDDFAPLKRLKRLERLFLKGTQITDSGMEHLSGLTNLQYLSLASTKITDEGLVHLQGMTKLEMLELSGANISDAGLKHLRGLKGLKVVYLNDTKVTEKGVEQLRAALPNCGVLLCPPGVFG